MNGRRHPRLCIFSLQTRYLCSRHATKVKDLDERNQLDASAFTLIAAEDVLLL